MNGTRWNALNPYKLCNNQNSSKENNLCEIPAKGYLSLSGVLITFRFCNHCYQALQREILSRFISHRGAALGTNVLRWCDSIYHEVMSSGSLDISKLRIIGDPVLISPAEPAFEARSAEVVTATG